MAIALSNSGRHALRFGLPAVVIFAILYVTFFRTGDKATIDLNSPSVDSVNWEFLYRRDWNNYGLSDEQCERAFPRYGHEVERAVRYRSKNHVSIDEMGTEWRDDGILRAMIYDNQLFVMEEKKVQADTRHRPRSLAILQSIYRAISAYPGTLPNVEFTLTLHDEAARVGTEQVEHTTWAFSRRAQEEQLWLMPDFGMWGWDDVRIPSYSFLQYSIEKTDDGEFRSSHPQLAWRGSATVGSADVRKRLLDISNGKEWSNVQAVDWSNITDLNDKWMTIEDHCRYMFVAQTEGHAWSGRMKYLLNCRSILMAHKLHWIELYHHLLVQSGPEQNYVQLNADFSDLEEKMDYYLSHIDEAEHIADNSVNTFRRRYLSPAAEACYWRKLIRGWSTVSFTPTLYEEVDETDSITGKTRKVQRLRGKPYEGFLISESVDSPLPAKAHRLCEFGD